MKNPNLIITLTAIFSLFFGAVNGQTVTANVDKAARLTAAMQKRLKLNDQQTPKITSVNLETIVSLKALKTADYASQQERITAIRKVRKNHIVQLKQILTPAQWTQYLAMQQEVRASRQNSRRGNLRRTRSFKVNTDRDNNALSEEELEELVSMDIFGEDDIN